MIGAKPGHSIYGDPGDRMHRRRARVAIAFGFLLAGTMTIVAAQHFALAENSALEDCRVNCLYGQCSADGFGCSCYCENGLPHCGCFF